MVIDTETSIGVIFWIASK